MFLACAIPIAKRQIRNELAQQLFLLALGVGGIFLQQVGNCDVRGVIALGCACGGVLAVRINSERLASILLMKPSYALGDVVDNPIVAFDHKRARRIVQVEQSHPRRTRRVPSCRHSPGLRLSQTGIMLAFGFENMCARAVAHR